MADVKALVDISTEQTSVATGDLLYVASGGVPAKVTFANLIDNNFAYSSQITLTGTINASGGTLTFADGQITGVSVAAATDTTRGTVQKSTSAENAAGTATDVFPDVAGVVEIIDAKSVKFTNATGANPDTGIVQTFAHGLASAPTRISAWLECTTAEAGFSVGDVVPIPSLEDGDGARNYGFSMDATNVYFSNDGNPILVTRRDNTNVHGITSANWDLRFTVWL